MARKNAVQQPGVEQKLIELSRLPDQEIFGQFKTDEDGLNQVEASERLEAYGRNIIDTGNENSLFKRVREAIINPFNIVLLAVAGVTLVTDVIIAESPNWATFLMLVFVIIVSGVISFVQSEKSNSAAQKLQRMISNKIDVIRNGSETEIDIEEAVPGDIVKLASGDMIPGGVRFIETKDLFIDQSQLTGESNPVEKFAGVDDEGDAIAELDNIGFMGSNIVSGSAKAVVLATGNQTYFGSMAKSLNSFQDKSSYEQNVDSIAFFRRCTVDALQVSPSEGPSTAVDYLHNEKRPAIAGRRISQSNRQAHLACTWPRLRKKFIM